MLKINNIGWVPEAPSNFGAGLSPMRPLVTRFSLD